MATARLYLKDSKAANITRVICVIADGREVLIKIPSDYSIKPKHWSQKNQKVHSANSNSAAINRQLEKFQNNVLNVYQEAKSNGLIVDAAYIKKKLKPAKKAVNQNEEFWNVWEYYLASKKNSFKERSYVKFKALANHLKEFEKHLKIPLRLAAFDVSLMESLQDYFFTIANLNNQTASKYLGILKMFLNWSFRQGYSKNLKFQEFKPIKQPETLHVILSDEDIKKIKRLKLGRKKYLANVREYLLLSINTGLRYSDYIRINPENYKPDKKGNGLLVIRQEKTGEVVEIPLTKESERIVKRVISGEVRPITNQRMNVYLKELCQLAEIDEPIEKHRFQAKMASSKVYPKYKLVSTHTGRRTFATKLLMKGVPANVVMKFTGHKDYKSFAKYVNIPKNAERDLVLKALMSG